MGNERSLEQIRLIADRFVEWQTPYGRPDPDRCPFVTQGKCISTKFHSPTFMAIGLYRAYAATDEPIYKAAADRYITFYLACMRQPPVGGQRQDYPSYPYQYGMALAGYELFRQHNPQEDSMDGKAAAEETLKKLLADPQLMAAMKTKLDQRPSADGATQ